MTLDMTAHAEQAIRALQRGDAVSAQQHLDAARRLARTSARRDRQLLEITGLALAGATTRAAGLAAVHGAEFPDDAASLEQIARPASVVAVTTTATPPARAAR